MAIHPYVDDRRGHQLFEDGSTSVTMFETGSTFLSNPPRPLGEADAPIIGLELAVRQFADRDVVEVRGELDAGTARALGESLRWVTAKVVEVDLAQLTFVDCAGVSVLLQAARRHSDRRELVLRSPTAAARRLFVLLGVDKQIRIEP